MASSSRHEETPDLSEEINILLLGESGVGKSTFINSCFNYLKYETLSDVLQNNLQVLIPARIRMKDMNWKEEIIDLKVNNDQFEPDDNDNEVLEEGKAATQDVRTYVFSVYLDNKKYRIRLIDTPGMGDNRGSDQDQKNCDLILGYLSNLKKIHGFCILLHPLNSRLTILLNYCMVQILSRLESSAVNNVAFVFTNTRGQNFRPGHTYGPLGVLLENIKKNNNIAIPLDKQNTFCFDNEAFSFIAAVKNGTQLEPFIQEVTEQSWNRSSKEFWRLLHYVSQLNPHDLKKTISINEARTMASQLSQPVIEIVQLIQDNILMLQQHTQELFEEKLTKEELMAKMYTPKIDVNILELEYPHTVCTHRDCISIYEVNGIRKTHYKSRCCTMCEATWITSEIVGNKGLYVCHAFGWNWQCRKCKHHLNIHKHIYYETEVFEQKLDKTMLPKVNSQGELVKLKEELIKTQNNLLQEYESEKQWLLNGCAIFDQYLKKNSVMPTGNTVEDYLKYQTTSENTFCQDPNDRTTNVLKDLLTQYGGIGTSFQNQDFTPEEIENIIEKLLSLKHFGPKIEKLYNLHKAGTRNAFKRKEKVVKGGVAGYFKQFQDIVKMGTAVASVFLK